MTKPAESVAVAADLVEDFARYGVPGDRRTRALEVIPSDVRFR
jgi:hypothetical protein